MEKVALSDIGKLARRVLATLPQNKNTATILALSGDLGAGKTTFVQVLGKELGITDTMQSPTYVLMKKYDISYRSFKILVHIDVYRLENPEQFAALNPEQFLRDPHTLVCIEWPEHVEGMLPAPDLTLRFSSEGAGERERFVEIRNPRP